MLKRINAFRIVFNFLLSIVELLIGMRFLIGILSGANEPAAELIKYINLSLGQIGITVSSLFFRSGISNSFAMLLLVLAFMMISFFLIIIAPKMTIRKERELELID